MWQAVMSIAALLTALSGIVLGVVGLVRAGRAQEAKDRASAAQESASAAGVGLEYLREAMAAQQVVLTRQEGEIGELRGQLKTCHEERQELAAKISGLEERMP